MLPENINSFDNFDDLKSQIQGVVKVLEQGIDPAIQLEFLQILSDIQSDAGFTDIQTEEVFRILSERTCPINEKKKYLAHLVSLSKVESFKPLKDFSSKTRSAIKPYALFALQLINMSLMHEFSDENDAFICSGLGGKNDALRVFCMIIPHYKCPFDDKQAKLIEREFSFQGMQKGVEVSNFKFLFEYASFEILLPFTISLNDFLTPAIDECNAYGNFISPHFFATNMRIPSHTELIHIINSKLT